jgi:hypothetical protein
LSTLAGRWRKRATYGLLQLSDKADGADFTAEDADRLSELAAFTGATLDAFRSARRSA